MGVATSQHNCPPHPGIQIIYYFHDTKYYPSFDFFPNYEKIEVLFLALKLYTKIGRGQTSVCGARVWQPLIWT